MSLSLPSKSGDVSTQLKFTCLPSQHIANRGLFDRFATLWGSWAVEEVLESSLRAPKKIWFAGDTGYRTVWEGEDESKMPVCPAFAEIGNRIGPFDLAMIPIGYAVLVHPLRLELTQSFLQGIRSTIGILNGSCFPLRQRQNIPRCEGEESPWNALGVKPFVFSHLHSC